MCRVSVYTACGVRLYSVSIALVRIACVTAEAQVAVAGSTLPTLVFQWRDAALVIWWSTNKAPNQDRRSFANVTKTFASLTYEFIR